jgi:hypothetical protein
MMARLGLCRDRAGRLRGDARSPDDRDESPNEPRRPALALLMAMAGPALAGATATRVFGSAHQSEDWASAGTGFTALNQRKAGTLESNVLLVPDGGTATQVNPEGTNADYPIIEMGNARLGDVLLFSQWRDRGPGDIKIYDLSSGTFVDAPSGVNTSAWENRPSVSGDHLFFGRGPANKPSTRAVLYDLASGTSEVIGKADYVWVGPLNGDWAVYQVCNRSCHIYRYQISTGMRTTVPVSRKWNYFPIVDDDGTVYFGASGWDCGLNVRLMSHVPGAPSSTVIKRFPDGIDIFPSDVVDHEIYFGRYNCHQEQGDIYRLTP